MPPAGVGPPPGDVVEPPSEGEDPFGHVSGDDAYGTFTRDDGYQWTVSLGQPSDQDPSGFIPGPETKPGSDEEAVGRILRNTLPDDLQGATKQQWEAWDRAGLTTRRPGGDMRQPDYSFNGKPGDEKTVSSSNALYQRLEESTAQGQTSVMYEPKGSPITEADNMQTVDEFYMGGQNNDSRYNQRIIIIEPNGEVLDCRWDRSQDQVVATRYPSVYPPPPSAPEGPGPGGTGSDTPHG